MFSAADEINIALCVRISIIVVSIFLLVPLSLTQTRASEEFESMQLLTPDVGWASTARHIYWTNSRGKQWKNITPVTADLKTIGGVFFLDNFKGWTLLSSSDAMGNIGFEMASTDDSGQTWSTTAVMISRINQDIAFTGHGSLFFIDRLHGWMILPIVTSSNFSRGILLQTTDGGRTWNTLSDPPVAGSVRFVNWNDGWLAGGPGGHELYVTHDSGYSWQPVAVQVLPGTYGIEQPSYDLPLLSDAQHGFLPMHLGRDGSITVFFETENAGRTWHLSKVTPGHGMLAAVAGPTLITASVLNRRSLKLTQTTGSGEVNSTVDVLIPDSNVLNISFSTSSQGWVLSSVGRCRGWKRGCFQLTQLLSTSDGGTHWTEITPSVSLQDETIDSDPSLEANLGPSISHDVTSTVATTTASSAATLISTNNGFDQCAAATAASMQTWYQNSPYLDTGIYIGGSTRGCPLQPNLTTSWVSQVSGMGWGLIPIWAGPQAPCNDRSITAVFSSDPTTANSQGITEANSAVAAAASLGLSGSIIYYDMESYTSATCGNAVKSFITGWTSQLHTNGYSAGIYGSPSNAASDFSMATTLPDDVWIALWNAQATVWNLSPLSNGLWVNKRIHQYRGPHNETWGGVPFTVDNDVEDGVLAGANLVPSIVTLSPTSAPVGGAQFNLTVTGTNFNTRSSVLWNGSTRASTMVNSSQLIATIGASDIAIAGTAQIAVLNPPPGGGTSTTLAFPIGGAYATTHAASLITSSSAALNGSVNPSGSSGYMYFQYGKDPTFTAVNTTYTQSVPANNNPQPFSVVVSSLSSNTTYYFRMVFVNQSNGSILYGSILNFTTLATPVTTLAATSITSSSATLNGSVTSNGSAGYMYFEYGKDPTFSQTATTYTRSVAPSNTPQPFSPVVSALSSKTKYYLRLVFVNQSNGSKVKGATLNFTTLQTVVTMLAMPTTSITSSSATLNGSVTSNGSAGYMYFEYGTDPAFSQTATTYTHSVAANDTSQQFSPVISGLTASTPYYFHIVFVNQSNGTTTYGNLCADPPGCKTSTFLGLPATGTVAVFTTARTLVATQPATSITSSSAALNGSVNSNGSAGYMYFEYGTDPTFSRTVTTYTQSVAANNNVQPLTIMISGLSSHTAFFLRLVFVNQNNGSTMYGSILQFATL